MNILYSVHSKKRLYAAEYNTLRQKKTAYYYDNTVRFIYFQYTFGIKIQNRKITQLQS